MIQVPPVGGTEEEKAELSVLVGDPWQGRGIGAGLMRRAIEIAKERGVQRIFGMVMAENTQMIARGLKLQCKFERLPGSSDLLLTPALYKTVASPPAG